MFITNQETKMPRKKNGKLPQLPEGAPAGSFPLTPEEMNELQIIGAENRFLRSESEKLQLRQNNLFLRIQLRTGKDMTGWGLDIQKGLCVPPSANDSKELASPGNPGS